MAINPNPGGIDYQMKTFSKPGEADVNVPFVGGQPQLAVPPGFAEKSKVMTTGQTTAQSILQQEGISSSKQLLSSMQVPTAKDILAEAGITSPTEILEKENIKQKNQALLAEEMELRQKELDYMKNYKFDANTFNPTAYETKYGNLDFKDAKIGLGWGWKDESLFYAYKYHIDGEEYYFMPESVATKGVVGPDNKQRYNAAFLNKDTWSALAESSQAIDLSNMDVSKLTKAQYKDPRFNATDDQLKAAQTRGFLFSEEDFIKFKDTYLDNKEGGAVWRNWGSLSSNYGTGRNQYGGDIQGMSQLPSGELVYITQPSTGYDQVSTYIDSQGTPWLHWYNAPRRKTLLQKAVGGIGDVLNAVPLLPEVLVLATGGPASPFAPYYIAAKGSQAYAAGGDLGDVITSMGTAYIATSPVMQNATASLSKTFTDSGLMTATTAKVAAGAVVNAGYAGTIAALTGQDVGKAITTGALTGGFAAGTPAIAEAIFGDVAAIDSMAGTLNMTRPQLQNLVVSSFGNAAISSAVYDRDFNEMFTQSLVANGLSVSAANTIEKNMRAGGKYDAAAIARAKKGTQLVVQATARAAIRGTDVNKELEAAMMKFTKDEVKRGVLTTAKEIGQKK